MASAKDAISAAEARLMTARFGLQDMKERKDRFQSGLMNAVVFGRMVTFALQNMRSHVAGFDEWYETKQTEMGADPMMRYFSDLRTKIEKRTARHTGARSHVTRFSASDLNRFEPAPPGAVSFFIGDETGGSGWLISRKDGSMEKYYVEMPPEFVKSNVFLLEAPPPLNEIPAPDLLERYLDELEKLLDEARDVFA